MSRRWIAVAAAVVVAVIVALGLGACGSGSGGGSGAGPGGASASGSGSATHTTTTRGSATTPAHPRRRHHVSPAQRRLRHAPPVGVRQGVHIDGTYLTVNVEGVLGLTDTGARLLPGTRAVGVQLQIANQSGATYDSTSSGDVSLVLSHGMSTPLDVRRGVCETPLVDFESMIVSGDVRSGCVAFSVPHAARVVGVRFSPFSRPRGALSWRVPQR